MLFLNVEHLDPRLYRVRAGRAAHCDCIVIARCGGELVAALFELKSLGTLVSSIRRLLTRRSGRGGIKELARSIIDEMNLDVKMTSCLDAAARTAKTLQLEPRQFIAVIVLDKNKLMQSLEKTITARSKAGLAVRLLDEILNALTSELMRRLSQTTPGTELRTTSLETYSPWEQGICGRLG